MDSFRALALATFQAGVGRGGFPALQSPFFTARAATSQKKGGLRVANDAVWGVLRPVLRDSISCQLALGLVFSGNLVQRRCG